MPKPKAKKPGIPIHVKDLLGSHGPLPPELVIYCAAVPRIGDVMNLFEVIPTTENRGGWIYEVDRVEWSALDGKYFEPVITVKKKK